MWEWPPAQRNDLGFKFEILAQSKCLKGALHSRTLRWSVSLFSVDMWCIHQITCKKWVVASLHLWQLQRTFIPFPSPPSNSSLSLARWDPECSREQAGDHLGRIHLFTLLLSFAISVRVAGSWAPPFPRGSMLLLVCLAVSQRQKEFSSQKGFLCYFVGLAFIFSNIARLLTPHEMTWCLRFALNYSI